MRHWICSLVCCALACEATDAVSADAALQTDLGVPDGAPIDAWIPPRPDYPTADDPRPFALSEVGLYRDIAALELAPDVVPFAPNFALWSDGADKARWIRLPPGARIDASDPDHWQLPVGAQLFKAFTRDGVRVETRLIARTGPGPRDYWMGAFVWRADGSDADFAPEGQANAGGTDHDVPSQKRCGTCHNGEPGRALGLSAIQSYRAAPLSVADLVARGWLEDPGDVDWSVPGAGVVQTALGYLHANCGNCHNPRGTSWPDTDLVLRLSVAERTPAATALYRSTLGVPLQFFDAEPGVVRVDPGVPENSGVLLRMTLRGPKQQMPPFASELPDGEGVAQVRAWISGLANAP